jgi:hypothetical protein
MGFAYKGCIYKGIHVQGNAYTRDFAYKEKHIHTRDFEYKGM